MYQFSNSIPVSFADNRHTPTQQALKIRGLQFFCQLYQVEEGLSRTSPVKCGKKCLEIVEQIAGWFDRQRGDQPECIRDQIRRNLLDIQDQGA